MRSLRERGSDLDEWRRRSPTSELSVGSSRVARAHIRSRAMNCGPCVGGSDAQEAQPEEPLHSFPLG